MAEIVVVIPGSAGDSPMDHKNDRLWIIVNGDIDWNPTDNNHCFNHLLLPAGHYVPATPRSAYGPYKAISAGQVTFTDPGNLEKHGKHRIANGHTITVS